MINNIELWIKNKSKEKTQKILSGNSNMKKSSKINSL